MSKPVTVLAPIKLAVNKSETDLLAASDKFQKEFVDTQPGVIRRELVRKNNKEYLDIIQFRSMEDAHEIIEKEKESPACHAFFAVMAMESEDETDSIEFYQSLATYESS